MKKFSSTLEDLSTVYQEIKEEEGLTREIITSRAFDILGRDLPDICINILEDELIKTDKQEEH